MLDAEFPSRRERDCVHFTHTQKSLKSKSPQRGNQWCRVTVQVQLLQTQLCWHWGLGTVGRVSVQHTGSPELESSVGQSSIMVYPYNLSTQEAGTGGSVQSVFVTCLVCMRFFLNYKAEDLKASFLHVACV